MRLLISFAALFLSVFLLQLSSGGVGPLDALSGLALGFSTAQIGLLGSAHFVGFFIGCWWAPRLLGTVGHSRAFAAFTAAGAIGLLSHTLTENPYAWTIFRVAIGICISGSYTVVEAWLQAKARNANRGRVMGVYRIVDTVGSLAAQLMIAVLEPAAYVSYNILALLCMAALFPLTLSQVRQPRTPKAPRLRPGLAWRLSPLSVAGVIVAAVSAASFRMVGPVYGQEVGLSTGQIAWFLAAWVLGGAMAQWPVGWLADKFDRRNVLIGLSVASIVSCATTIALGAAGDLAVFANATIFGMVSYPIYSVSAAHAHDFADSSERVELSAGLMFFFAVGAIGAPYLSSTLIQGFGPAALFGMIAVAHAGLILFGMVRRRARPTVEDRTPYVYSPRTSFTIGRLLRGQRDTK
ncbi:putative MFS family arabinose efflux permease [Aliiruegeria haliotis]|uniref:Putative MFS family arabinose efflux permease n=1 Tax=Aliiruegeria haliotis TaxID=1280846 RepID=A0A2T0RUT8_9RHOB|nr:MFS transporter [Aliiruegeria haliotis]PRY24920.1 putative MFS family arabinose efflux permease [Aliiruegeria haliotis]